MRPTYHALTVLALLAACNPYVYHAPEWREHDASKRGEAVKYRPLTRADFQGEYEKDSGLDAKVSISAFSDTVSITPLEIPSNPDSARWEFSLADVRFHAVMYPKSSFWNPKRKSEKDVHRLLDHEQGHFDIMEIVVRKANARVQAIRGLGRTPEEAQRKAEQLLNKESDALQKEMEDWTSRYEYETRNGAMKLVQQRWRDLLNQELATTDPSKPAIQ